MTVHVFPRMLYLCCKVSECVWLCHHWPPGGVDLALIQAHLIRSGRLSNLTGNATDAHAAVPHLGHASCLALKISPVAPTALQYLHWAEEHLQSSGIESTRPLSCTFRTSLPAHFRLELRSGILHLSLQ